MSTVIKVENLSKQYRLGKIGTGTLTHDINRWWYVLRGKEDPYLKIGDTNDRTAKSDNQYVWSLRNLNFEIQRGDAVGVIGRNGAGKSTLLKVLSRTTSPTIGKIKIKGRIASLLEVGTGFHPELSGRENIYLNGAILGMSKSEIRLKFDEIVDFAGIERYIDTPVKRYSSGMYVRLAFGVAAHLEPEILIVDEVLAVGDTEFQKKALGKMQDVSRGGGRTVIFVSHNMAAISALCNKSIVLNNGELVYNGDVKKGVEYYLNTGNKINEALFVNNTPKSIDIIEASILNRNSTITNAFSFDEKIVIRIKVRLNDYSRNAELAIRMKDKLERIVFTSQFNMNNIYNGPGDYTVETSIPDSILVPNSYYPILALHIPNVEILSFKEGQLMFDIEETGTNFHQYSGTDYGCVFVDCKWRRLD